MTLNTSLLAEHPVLSLTVAAFLGVLLWISLSYARNKIPGPPSESFLNGNLERLFTRDALDFQRHIALDYGPVAKLNGFFGEPILYVSDPKALHTMLIKDECIFQETGVFLGVNRAVFGTCLLSTLGPHHGRQRKILNPAFSVNHMRDMLPLFYDLGHKFRDAIKARVSDDPQELDMLGWLGRVALELVGQGTLGYSFDPLLRDKPDSYGQALKSLVPKLDSIAILQRLIPLFESLPRWMLSAAVQAFPTGTRIHEIAKVVNTLDQRTKEIYAEKKRALAKGGAEMAKQVGQGKDIISVLLRANAAADEKDRLSEEEVIAQMSMFIVAGLDTTSNALSRILTVLAQHPGHQQKLRQELLDSRAADGLVYDDLGRLPILDATIRETLRLYPPATILFRTANKDTVLPLSEPVHTTDGKIMDAIPVAKGSQCLVGFIGSNMSKTMWGEDALEWKPERWLSTLPTAVTESRIPGVYSNLMTFSGGKRACIGFKFSEMEMKVVLSILVSNFTFEFSDKPIEWNVGGVMYPTVGKESNKPELPLKVGLYKPPAMV
ncbi:hypothetical protein FOMPIDRAFT_1048392 [Fomitopsis schrenkii]|uniref:Cytochrome P450 n=1 Tax=Fomitopsis schrenkii TaxID=2126942 RepID=S8FK44_FOMSC|nr:hypothetical protein FOMPIDRAFT_1048392 [Fomitopsis schrenkii]